MFTPAVIAAIAGALLFFWVIGAYNRMVRLRAAAGKAFAALEPLLKEQLAWVQSSVPAPSAGVDSPAADEQPAAWARLLAASEQFALALGPVRAQPLSAGAMNSLAQARAVLDAAWGDAQALLGATADGQASAEPPQLQWDKLRQQEIPLVAAFDAAVQAHNAAVRQFPANVLARLCGFRAGQAFGAAEPRP